MGQILLRVILPFSISMQIYAVLVSIPFLLMYSFCSLNSSKFVPSNLTAKLRDTCQTLCRENIGGVEKYSTELVEFSAEVIDSKTPIPGSESFSKALFTMDIGRNDLHAGLISMNEEQVKADVPRILDQFSVALEKLYKLSVQAFWMHSTGPIGCLPYFIFGHTAKPNSTDSNGCIKSYNEVAQDFNKQLKDKMINLRSQFQDAMLIYVDIYSVKYSWISDGKNNGENIILRGFPDPIGYRCGRFGVVECGEKSMFNGT